MMTSLEWAVAALGALMVGVSKTGVSGLGLLAVVLFAQIMPAKEATGAVLPLLLVGDVVAVASYRGHADLRFIARLFPWAAVGVVAGYFALSVVNDRQAKALIGAIVLVLVGVSVFRQRSQGGGAPLPAWVAPFVGMLAGFTTLVSNAAGPLMAIYLLAMSLPKLEYMGTSAVFFCLLNAFKVPFMASLGLITARSLHLNLILVPAVLAGTWAGRKLLIGLKQRQFEWAVLGLTALSGLKLLF